MNDLMAAFMPKFTAVAKTRVARSIDLAQQRTSDSAATIARELHAIAGEAGLLGVTSVLALARTGEDHARRLRTAHNDVDAEALLVTLDELKRTIEQLSAQTEKSA